MYRLTRHQKTPLAAPQAVASASGSFDELFSRPRVRAAVLPLADGLGVALAVYLAFFFRFDPAPLTIVIPWIPIAVLPIVVRPVVNRALGLYGHAWRYISVPEMVQVFWAVAAGSFVLLVLYAFLSFVGVPATTGFPRSFWILEAILSGVAMAGLRMAPRVVGDIQRTARKRTPQTSAATTILFGAGEAGAAMARAAFRERSAGLHPVGFLDDNPRKWGRRHAGLRVMGGLASLEAAAKATNAGTVLITMPTADGESVRRVADAALDLGLRVRTAPSLDEMMEGPVTPRAIRPLRPEDLLRRPPVSTEALASLQEELASELVLVTGAGGSIGSELARQLILLRPRALVLLDRAEGPLYDVQRDIQARLARSGQPPLDVRFRIGDISNRREMARLIRSIRPGLILHAAAYKHVPMMEENPVGAVEVNVGGTLALLDAAADSGVNRFVLVSTDKAVEPASVMGATKRIAELLVTEMSRELGRPWVAVRFGNVLGSSGSVVPIFQQQLEASEPLTVTHHEMTRYFMTIPEAVHLILQAASLARCADLFLLDMGDPVRVLDLARDVLRLTGQDSNLARIEFSGLRPGEKLHVRLLYESEAVEPTAHPKIQRVAQETPATSPRAAAEVLLRIAAAGEDSILKTQLMSYVQEGPPTPLRAFPITPATSPLGKRAGSHAPSGARRK